MNSEIIHHQLAELLETIQEQYEAIRNTQGRIPQIEFDILQDNIRKFYDQLHLLGKMNTTTPSVKSGHAPTLLPTEHAPTQPIQPVQPVQPVQSVQPVQPASPSSPPSPPHHISDSPPPHVITSKKETVTEAKKSKPADMDLFTSEEPLFNMKLREAREQTLPPKAEPVQHLKQLININDKFTFINELFDGSLKEYNEAIETLNGFKVKNDAYEYLDLLRKKNLWELESGTLMKLKDIVERYHE